MNASRDIKSLIKEYKTTYGDDPNLFGFTKNLDAKIQTLQNSIFPDKKPSASTLAQTKLGIKLLLQMQEYRRSVTGAAASVLESAEYDNLFPKGSTGQEIAMSKIEAFDEVLQSEYQNKIVSIL